MYPKLAKRFTEPSLWALKAYNESLEEESAPSNLNEEFLESNLCELEQIKPDRPEAHEIYWLTYARLFELALLCAGNYVDQFEFAAAGDLLVNPRLILIHFKSGCHAVKKDRHRKLTEQFGYVADTFPEIVEKPLLAHMHEEMACSGYLSKEYLYLGKCRMERIADTIGFLASWHLTSENAFHLQVQGLSPSEKSFIESNLCRFDKGIFFELGRDVRELDLDSYEESRFLGAQRICRLSGTRSSNKSEFVTT